MDVYIGLISGVRRMNVNELDDLILQAQLFESRTIERQAQQIADLKQEIEKLKKECERNIQDKIFENLMSLYDKESK